MQIEYDISYSPNRTCDIYKLSKHSLHKTPNSTQPLVFLVHGGVWSFGCKQRLAGVAMTLCQFTQCVCVIPEYSLSELNYVLLQHVLTADWVCLALLFVFVRHKKLLFVSMLISIVLTVLILIKLIRTSQQKPNHNVHPVHATDIATCIEWVHTNANRFQADKSRMILIGHSAGAHICALVTLNERFLPQNIRNDIRGVIGLSGVYCFFNLQKSIMKHFVNLNVFAEDADGLTETTFAEFDNLHKCDCEKCKLQLKRWDAVIDAWPRFHTRKKQHAIKNAAFLLVTSEMDLTLIDHAVVFAEELRKNNWKVQHVHFPSTNHFSIRKYWDVEHKHIRSAVVGFINTICI